jgi:hypothetical protein
MRAAYHDFEGDLMKIGLVQDFAKGKAAGLGQAGHEG